MIVNPVVSASDLSPNTVQMGPTDNEQEEGKIWVQE